MSRHSRYDRYDHGYRRAPFTGWYPGAYWAGAPMFGWGGGWGWPPYVPAGYGGYPDPVTPRRPPRRSPAYGRGGDEAVRRWAERYGYDVEHSLPPHPAGPPPRRHGYDRGYRSRW